MRLFLLALLLVFAACALVTQTARQDKLDDASIADAARILESAIRSAVSQAGGDLEKQHVHLVLAFSTGHFNKDPLGAQAARQIAWLVVKDLLVAGDRVSVFAWEMNLWDHLQGKDNSLVLSGSDEKSKQPVQDLFPNTVQDGSQGGHDTERAIVEITRRLGDARDAVIVLITNDAQSVAPKGLQTIGADNPEYQQVLQTWQRLPQVNERGASVELAFTVQRGSGDKLRRRLDAVIVVSQPFLSGPKVGGGGPPVLLFAAIASIILIFIALLAREREKLRKWIKQLCQSPGQEALFVNGEFVSLIQAHDSGVICRLVGRKHKSLAEDGLPRVVIDDDCADNIAEIVHEKGKLQVIPRFGKIRRVNGEPSLNEPLLLHQNEDTDVLFEVTYQEETLGFPAKKRVKVRITWKRVREQELTKTAGGSEEDGNRSH